MVNKIMKKYAFLGTVLVLASVIFADPTASIFVKDPSEFKKIQSELESIKAGLGEDNPEIKALLEEAGKIAEMNDRCSMIAINEVLDDECGRFYAEDLPAFETKYMELTGEFRLGSLKMGSSLAERTEQIKICADALAGIIIPKRQLLKLNGNMFLEPLSFEGAFDATYDFNFYYDSDRMETQKNMMERWVSKCGEIALRQAGDEYAPLFVQSVEMMNDSLAKADANVKVVLDPKELDFYIDLNEDVSGAYFLNGAMLFSSKVEPTDRQHAHIIVDVVNKRVELPMGVDGNMQNFKGRVEFTAAYQEKDLVGRWVWGDREYANRAVAKGELSPKAVVGDTSKPAPVVKNLSGESVEETLKQDLNEMKASDAAKAAAKSDEKESKIHWIPLSISAVVAVGGGVLAIMENNVAKTERNKAPKSVQQYKDRYDKIEKAQKMRKVGIGVAAVGAVGVGLSLVF